MSDIEDGKINIAGMSAEKIDALNKRYHPLSVEERMRALYHDFDQEKVMATSSFAANSAYFLYLFSQYMPNQKIFFIDTGFHFPETLEYKEKLTALYGLNVIDVRAEKSKHEVTEKEKIYQSDPDYCCTINKIEPFAEIKQDYHVWISSVMRWQTDHRADLDIFEVRGGIIKFYPMVDVSKEDRANYIKEHNLPFHPMVSKGYSSIGCIHCTKPGDDRSGRWVDSQKTECGIHL